MKDFKRWGIDTAVRNKSKTFFRKVPSWQPLQSRAINFSALCQYYMSSTPEGPLSILNLIVHFLSYQLSSIVFSFVIRSFPAWFCRLTCFSFAILNHCPTKCLFSPIRWSKNLNQDHKAQNPEESLIKFTCSFPELLWLIGPERKNQHILYFCYSNYSLL